METAMLILRVVVGLLFIGHGTQKLFGWFGGHGLDGTAGFMRSLGYRPGHPHAVAAGLTEAMAGLLLTVGLGTPFAAAAVIGVMLNAIATVHGTNGLWITSGGYEYNAVLIAVAVAVATGGAGVLSFDEALGWELHGPWWGLAALVLGGASSAAVLSQRQPEAATAGTEPALEAEDHRVGHAA
jgi:putative oxidoreductase